MQEKRTKGKNKILNSKQRIKGNRRCTRCTTLRAYEFTPALALLSKTMPTRQESLAARDKADGANAVRFSRGIECHVELFWGQNPGKRAGSSGSIRRYLKYRYK